MSPTAQSMPLDETLTVLAAITDPCFRMNADGAITYANAPAQVLLQRQVDPVVGGDARTVFPDAFGALFNEECKRARLSGMIGQYEEQYLPLDTWFDVRLYPDQAGVTVLMHDIAGRRLAAELLEGQNHVLEQIARGQPLRAVLEAVTGLVERHGAGMTCAVFATEEAGRRLTLAAAPSLPQEYAQSFEAVDIAAGGSPIAQAAFSVSTVMALDFLVPDSAIKRKFRDASVKHAFRAVWCIPIASSEGSLLGVLAVWRREPGAPGGSQKSLLQTAAHLAAIALERRQVESDLRQREQEYRAIFETVQDALIVTDADGFVVEANPAAWRLHGGQYQDLIRTQAMTLVRPDYHGALRRALDDVRQGREFHGELVGTRRDGSSFPAELTAAPFTFKGQRHLLAIVRDLTARKKIEDSLRGSEERLRTVANGAPIVLFSLDRAGIVTLSEGQALASLGLRAGEVVGRNIFDLYRTEPELLANLRTVLSGEALRWVVELADRVFETTARPLRSPRGEIIGAVGVAVDITDHALTEDALRESEERFRVAFHQAPVGVAHTALNGDILRANDRLAAILQVRPDELAGRRLVEWYLPGPSETSPANSSVRQLLSRERVWTATERHLRRSDGATVRAIVSESLVLGRQEQARHMIQTVTPLD